MIRDGVYYGVGFGSAALIVAFWLDALMALPLLAAGIFCVYFFRDPERKVPEGSVAVSPADGKVVHVCDLGDGVCRVSVFLNIFDVHVNRMPVSGVVTSMEYRPGSFKMAYLQDASTQNEQNSVTIRADGCHVTVKQIAGLIARRIVCNKNVGDVVSKGERFGLIKFGSRVDVCFGSEWELAVSVGDRVLGGSSIMARRVTTNLVK